LFQLFFVNLQIEKTDLTTHGIYAKINVGTDVDVRASGALNKTHIIDGSNVFYVNPVWHRPGIVRGKFWYTIPWRFGP